MFFAPRSKSQKFAILMPWGRVGSNLVVSQLEDLRSVYILNEPTTGAVSRARQKQSDFRFEADKEQALCFDTLGSSLKSNAFAKFAGMKISHRSLISPMYFYKKLHSENYQIIRMVRNDFLRCAVSKIRAEQRANALKQSGQKPKWSLGSDETEAGALPVNPDRAMQIAANFEKEHASLLAYTDHVFEKKLLHVEYDQLRVDPLKTIGDIFAYIGLDVKPNSELKHKKATPNDLRSAIKNYDAFSEKIKETQYAKYLD